MSLYSIVVPVYNSEKTLEELYTRIRDVFDHTMKENFELILVDDSSRDNSYEVMEKLHKADSRVKIIQMAKNFGQHPALLCGFSFAKGDFIITMDDDLQHRPEEIPKMAAAINERDDVDPCGETNPSPGLMFGEKRGCKDNLPPFLRLLPSLIR